MITLPGGRQMTRDEIMVFINKITIRASEDEDPKDPKEPGDSEKDPPPPPKEPWLRACGGCQGKSRELDAKSLDSLVGDRLKLASAILMDDFTVQEMQQLVQVGLVPETALNALQIQAIRSLK